VLRRVAIGAAALVALLALAVFLVDWEELARGAAKAATERRRHEPTHVSSRVRRSHAVTRSLPA
jgi:hypothetical protein